MDVESCNNSNITEHIPDLKCLYSKTWIFCLQNLLTTEKDEEDEDKELVSQDNMFNKNVFALLEFIIKRRRGRAIYILSALHPQLDLQFRTLRDRWKPKEQHQIQLRYLWIQEKHNALVETIMQSIQKIHETIMKQQQHNISSFSH